MYREELSDLEKLEQYRYCLECEPATMEAATRKYVIDEIFRYIELGYGEPVEVAYNLYLKYMALMNAVGDDKHEWANIFSDMCDEASYVIDVCDSFIE